MADENIGRPDRYTTAQVIEALKATRGIQAAAARRLGCNRMTIANYIERYATVRQAYEEQREVLLDVAEGQLVKKVEAGDDAAVMFVLRTIGRHRGYGETSRSLNLNVTPDELAKMSDEELATLEQRLSTR